MRREQWGRLEQRVRGGPQGPECRVGGQAGDRESQVGAMLSSKPAGLVAWTSAVRGPECWLGRQGGEPRVALGSWLRHGGCRGIAESWGRMELGQHACRLGRRVAE